MRTTKSSMLHFCCVVSLASSFVQPGARADEGGAWAPLPSMNLARHEIGAARVGDRVYVFGGLIDGAERTATDTVEMYDPNTGQWTFVTPMPEPRDHLGVAAVGGLIYVSGGWSADFVARDNLWIYDPSTDSWTVGPDLPAPRASHAAVSHADGRMYLVGGVDIGKGVLLPIYVFDAITSTWSLGADIPNGREHVSAVSARGEIYVIGGRVALSPKRFNESYDPLTDTWTAHRRMPTARAGLAAAAIGGRIIVTGGEVPVLYDLNEVFDISTESWTCQRPIVPARHGHAMVTIPETGKIMVIAGAIVQGPEQPVTRVDTFSPGPTFDFVGTCPTRLDVILRGATPGGRVVFLIAESRGTQTIPPTFVCAGVSLGLDATVAVATVRRADASGNMTFTTSVPPAYCGTRFAQVLDVAACLTSNVIEIQ